MEVVKNLDDLVVMVGLSVQDEPTLYAVVKSNEVWRSAPVFWGTPGTERIEVYEVSLAGKPLRTIVTEEYEAAKARGAGPTTCEVCQKVLEGQPIRVEVRDEEDPPRWLTVCSEDCLQKVIGSWKQILEVERP